MLFDILLYCSNTYWFDTPGYLQLYLSIIKVLCVSVFFLLYVSTLKFNKKEIIIDVIVLIIWLYISFVIFLNKDTYGIAGKEFVSALDQHKGFLINFLFYYVLGKSLYIDDKVISVRVYILFYFFLILAMLISFDVNKFVLLSISEDSIYTGSYLQIGDFLSILSLIFLAYIRSEKLQYLLIILSGLMLYLVGSRGALYAFLLTITIYIIYDFRNMINIRKVLLIFILSSFFLLCVGVFSDIYSDFNLKDSRMLSILFSYDDDYSANARNILLSQGLEDIMNNFFWGDFSGQLKHYGDDQGTRWGGYIHSILSYWRQFGLIPFILFSLLWFYSFVFILMKKNIQISTRNKTTFLILIFCFMEMLFVRSYFTSYLLIGLGLSSTNINLKKYEN